MKRPLTCVNLIKAIGTLSVGQDPVRLSRAIANVIVAQMLPDGVVKGGSSLLFRYGRYGSRYTRDIDTARVMELESYLKQLNEALSHGWNGGLESLEFRGKRYPFSYTEGSFFIPGKQSKNVF